MGGGVIWMVGTGGIVGNSPFVTVLSFALGTQFAVLGSGLWKTEKTRLRRDRLKPPNHHVDWWDQARMDKQMI